MNINVLTLFPEMFEGFLTTSIINRAIENNKLSVNLYNFRDFAFDKHKRVDDTSYGGGAGMVLKVEPIHKCLESISNKGKVIALTPSGIKFNDEIATRLSELDDITLICGHYEGFDERVYNYVDMELSIGDFVLTGGEIAACAVIDAVTRKVPGVLNPDSLVSESFTNNTLDYPVYTKPEEYDGYRVPDVLLSGNHEKIKQYREAEAMRKTNERRKELLNK